MYKVVVASARAVTNVAYELNWSTYNKHFDTVDDPHLFNNRFEIETSIDTMHSLTWKQKELRDQDSRTQGTKDSRTEIQAEGWVKMPMSSIETIRPFIHITCYYQTYTTNFGKNNDIIKGDRDYNEGVLHYEKSVSNS